MLNKKGPRQSFKPSSLHPQDNSLHLELLVTIEICLKEDGRNSLTRYSKDGAVAVLLLYESSDLLPLSAVLSYKAVTL